MDGMEKVLDAYKYYESSWFRRYVKAKFENGAGKGKKEEEYVKMKKLHFFKRWPDIRVAGMPGNVIWSNI